MSMKHLILFEKFKSLKLSKTLGYIKDDSNFLEYVKKIAKSFDFPYSELSDDMFEYLPFNSALKVNTKIDNTPKKCDGESEWIPGEFCQEGKVKRTWGKGIRIVPCSKCGGTGFLKPTTTPNIYCVKFWFNSEGKLISVTGSDGTSDNSSSGSINTNGYIRGESYSPGEIRSSGLKTGDKVIMIKDRREHVGVIYQYDNMYFFIGDTISIGGTPDDRGWRQYGSRSWNLGGSDHGNIIRLIPKKDGESNENPYDSNYKLDFSYRGITLSKGYNMETALKDAHFAIILFMDKLRGEFKKGTSIRSERETARKGSTKLMEDDDIRHENIERYIQQLSDKFSLAEGISGITKVLPRVMGGSSNIAYYVHNSRNFNYTNDVITYLYKFIKAKDDSGRQNAVESIKYNLQSIYRDNMNVNGYISKNKEEVKKKLKSLGKENIIEVIESFDKLNAKIFNKINVNIETLEDMEVVYAKLKSIKEILKRDRYTIRYLSNYIDYLQRKDGARNCLYYLQDYIDGSRYQDIIDDINIVGNVIDKL